MVGTPRISPAVYRFRLLPAAAKSISPRLAAFSPLPAKSRRNISVIIGNQGRLRNSHPCRPCAERRCTIRAVHTQRPISMLIGDYSCLSTLLSWPVFRRAGPSPVLKASVSGNQEQEEQKACFKQTVCFLVEQRIELRRVRAGALVLAGPWLRRRRHLAGRLRALAPQRFVQRENCAHAFSLRAVACENWKSTTKIRTWACAKPELRCAPHAQRNKRMIAKQNNQKLLRLRMY